MQLFVRGGAAKNANTRFVEASAAGALGQDGRRRGEHRLLNRRNPAVLIYILFFILFGKTDSYFYIYEVVVFIAIN